MSWVESLKQYNESHSSSSAVDHSEAAEHARAHAQEKEVLRELREIYLAEARAKAKPASSSTGAKTPSKSASVDEIPRFYIKRTTSPPPPDPVVAEVTEDGVPPPPPILSLSTQLRREARTRYLIARAEQLLDDRELGILWETIQIHSVDTNTSTGVVTPAPAHGRSVSGGSAVSSPVSLFDVEKRLNYDSFLLVSHSLPQVKAARYFKPSTFLSFPQDAHGRISSRALWRYVTKKMQLTRLRISLTCYDDVGYGYLREQDLENYVYDQLATLPPLQSLERDFYPYYVFTAVRKFVFFLDTHRRGKLRIKAIVESPVMVEFDALRYPHGHLQGTKKNSWFSAQHTQDVYAIYLGLDSNQNGMLSREEFRAFNGGNLTNIFIEGLFAEYRMYPSSAAQGEEGEENAASYPPIGSEDDAAELEMDYKTFLDFVLAMDYKTTPASIAYFFKVLDIHRRGYLDTFTLNYWFRAVAERIAHMGHDTVDPADVAVR